MSAQIRGLNKQIEDEMITKFGSKIEIDELEEAVLRRLVQELRLAMLNIKEMYQKELTQWTDVFASKQVELKNIIKENTARLEVYAILNQEKTYLTQFLNQQMKKMEHVEKRVGMTEDFFFKDIERLKKVVEMQNEQIEVILSFHIIYT